MRNTGVHVCGVIITPDDITNFVPIALAKNSELFITQFDNSVVESAGLLKMDFLGLKTLTILKDAVALIQKRYGLEIDIERRQRNLPLVTVVRCIAERSSENIPFLRNRVFRRPRS